VDLQVMLAEWQDALDGDFSMSGGIGKD